MLAIRPEPESDEVCEVVSDVVVAIAVDAKGMEIFRRGRITIRSAPGYRTWQRESKHQDCGTVAQRHLFAHIWRNKRVFTNFYQF